MMRAKPLAVFLSFLLLAPTVALAAKKAKVPVWVQSAMDRGYPYDRFEGKNNGMVLLDHGFVEYLGKDTSSAVFRKAVHIQTRDQREHAAVTISLPNREAKLKSFAAWIIYPSGRVEGFSKRDLVEVADEMDSLYSESSSLFLDRTDSARDDTVFAFEYEVEYRSSFLEEVWLFQDSIPTLESKFELEVPSGWQVNGVVLNGIDVERANEGNRHVWTARDLPSLKDEPASPPRRAIFGLLGVSVRPDDKSIDRYRLKTFQDWGDIARYAYQVQVNQVIPSEEIAAKASSLTVGLSTDWEKVKSICEYVQSVNYVAVNMGLARGGGYTPRAASSVFETHFGDCKDMTGLARAMLACVGIESYPIIASIGDDQYVHDQWYSPAQFNHCVVGVALDREVDVPAMVTHPRLGSLLVFDPTQKSTPVGRLPGSLQGGKILVGSGLNGKQTLLELSSPPPEENRVERKMDLSLDEDGNLSGRIQEEAYGTSADFLRHLKRSLSEEDFQKFFHLWIAGGTREASIGTIGFEDDLEGNRIELVIEFSAPRYARKLGDAKLLFSPVFLTRMDWVPPTDEERTTDYVFSPWALIEMAQFRFPEGFELESKKEGIRRDEDYMDYEIHSDADGAGVLSVTREMRSKHRVLPPSDYAKVVSFYEEITRAESSPVVIGR